MVFRSPVATPSFDSYICCYSDTLPSKSYFVSHFYINYLLIKMTVLTSFLCHFALLVMAEIFPSIYDLIHATLSTYTYCYTFNYVNFEWVIGHGIFCYYSCNNHFSNNIIYILLCIDGSFHLLSQVSIA